MYAQDISKSERWKSTKQLPNTLKMLLSVKFRERFSQPKPPKATTIRAALAALVASSAGMQTLKGLFTAGVTKSANYAMNKIGKRFFPPSATAVRFNSSISKHELQFS